MSWPEQPAVVRAPATSANLGPGFDALGLALSLHDVVEARVTGGGLDIEVAGEGAGSAGDGERHLVARALRAGFDALGGQPPGIGLRCQNAIPHGRGLGSSAAAIVSGLLAARALVRDGPDRLPGPDLFRLAAELEGHPDNVAACLAGGLTIAWSPGPGARQGPGAQQGPGERPRPGVPPGPRVLRLPVAAGLAPVVCVAPGWLATEAARRALPATVPHPDAAANAARSALLVAALSALPPDPAGAAPMAADPAGPVPGAADPAVLFDATEDYLHQRYRAAVMPETADLLGRLRDTRLPAVLSGAGPSVLVLTTADPQAGHGLVDSIARETGIAWRVTPLEIDRHGAAAQSPWPGADSPASSWRMHPEGRAQHPGTSPAETSPHGNAASAVTRGRP